jgi:lipoate-protein ligase A
MNRIKFYLSSEDDPWFNLALEDYIFRTMDTSVPVLFLWRNRPSVIIGRYQNPWIECHLNAMEEDHIELVRRQSGGGTVYHDWGNTNFSFLAGNEIYTNKTAFKIISKGLEKFSVSAVISERNDLIVDYQGRMRKFSGSAFRQLNDRAFHHGTLLLNADLSSLERYLTPRLRKLQIKGIRSVKSEVINLEEINSHINHEDVTESIKESFGEFFDRPVETILWEKKDVLPIIKFQKTYEQLTSHSWIYGKTPPFIHSLEGYLGKEKVHGSLYVREGKIEKFESGDFQLSLFEQEVNSRLTGVPYHYESIKEALTGDELKKLNEKLLPNEISQFIIENII